jgi:hypothetical protein
VTTHTTTLDERYGRTPSRRRRGRLGAVIGAAVLLIALIAWGVWTGVGGTATPVQWLVTGRAGTTMVCAIEAQDESGAVVGLAEVVVRPTGNPIRSGTTLVRTVRAASTGLIASCRDA